MTALSYPLPANFGLIANLRDVMVLDIPSAPTKPPTFTRTGVIFDADRDMRVLDVLFALHARDRAIRANVIGIAETKATLTFWYGDPETIEFCLRPMIEAANSVLFPYDKWNVAPPILVPMLPNGTLDRDNLAARDLLRAVPERYSLGLVQP